MRFLVFVGLTTIIFLTMSLAVRFHFSSQRMSAGMRVISVISLSNFALALYGASLPDGTFNLGFGSAMMIASFLLFLWALYTTRGRRFRLAFDEDYGAISICRGGPYRISRHPFYVAYALFWLGATIVTQSAIVAVLSLVLLILYLSAAMREERGLTRSAIGSEYEAYRREVGIFLMLGRAK